MPRQKTTNFPPAKDVDIFDRLMPLLEKLNNELSELSKKKPDDCLNKLKVKMINQVLAPLKEVLNTDPNSSFLVLLNEEELPSNSDAVFITGQFLTVLSQFKERFYIYDRHTMDSRWHTQENP